MHGRDFPASFVEREPCLANVRRALKWIAVGRDDLERRAEMKLRTLTIAERNRCDPPRRELIDAGESVVGQLVEIAEQLVQIIFAQPRSERARDETFILPLFPQMTDSEVDYVVHSTEQLLA